MPRIAYVNGTYVRHAEAAIHVEDRGYQFADGVYEVCEVRHGFIIDLTRHLDRLGRSLGELRIGWPMSRAALIHVIREVLRRNRVRNGLFYLQVTRGVARRDHVFPDADTPPSIVVTAKRTDPGAIARKNAEGISAITVPENRWDRVDIKSVGLLPNVLARQQAKEAGAQEAIFVDVDGMVKEGGGDECMDRGPRRDVTHPPGGKWHSARRDPHHPDGRGQAAGPCDRGNGLLRGRNARSAGGLHHRCYQHLLSRRFRRRKDDRQRSSRKHSTEYSRGLFRHCGKDGDLIPNPAEVPGSYVTP